MIEHFHRHSAGAFDVACNRPSGRAGCRSFPSTFISKLEALTNPKNSYDKAPTDDSVHRAGVGENNILVWPYKPRAGLSLKTSQRTTKWKRDDNLHLHHEGETKSITKQEHLKSPRPPACLGRSLEFRFELPAVSVLSSPVHSSTILHDVPKGVSGAKVERPYRTVSSQTWGCARRVLWREYKLCGTGKMRRTGSKRGETFKQTYAFTYHRRACTQ